MRIKWNKYIGTILTVEYYKSSIWILCRIIKQVKFITFIPFPLSIKNYHLKKKKKLSPFRLSILAFSLLSHISKQKLSLCFYSLGLWLINQSVSVLGSWGIQENEKKRWVWLASLGHSALVWWIYFAYLEVFTVFAQVPPKIIFKNYIFSC